MYFSATQADFRVKALHDKQCQTDSIIEAVQTVPNIQMTDHTDGPDDTEGDQANDPCPDHEEDSDDSYAPSDEETSR